MTIPAEHPSPHRIMPVMKCYDQGWALLITFGWGDSKMQEVKVKAGGDTQSSLFTLFPHLQRVICGKGLLQMQSSAPRAAVGRGINKAEWRAMCRTVSLFVEAMGYQ